MHRIGRATGEVCTWPFDTLVRFLPRKCCPKHRPRAHSRPKQYRFTLSRVPTSLGVPFLDCTHVHTHAQIERERGSPLFALETQPVNRRTDRPRSPTNGRSSGSLSPPIRGGGRGGGGGSRYDWLGYNSGRAATLVYRPCHTPSSPSSLTWRSEFPSTVLRVFVAAGNKRISRYASSVNVVPEQVTLPSNLYSSLYTLSLSLYTAIYG